MFWLLFASCIFGTSQQGYIDQWVEVNCACVDEGGREAARATLASSSGDINTMTSADCEQILHDGNWTKMDEDACLSDKDDLEECLELIDELMEEAEGDGVCPPMDEEIGQDMDCRPRTLYNSDNCD